ncbi:MAG: class I SAM-dependent methyltransferase [Prolixibacteraceae bacterium]|nr:class I SAM-dependent methyltransferase [Prolixibacteraceae bacterium]
MSNYSDSSFGDESAYTNTSWYKIFHLVPDKAKVLDVGCSSGNFGVELIKRKNCAVDGIELDDDDYKAAKKKLRKVYNLNIETNNLNDIDKDYDIINFGDVIEHLVDPAKVLKNIKNHLAKNGSVLFSVPNMAHIAIRLELLGGKFEYAETGLLDKTHLHFYTQDEVFNIFSAAGYEIEALDFVTKDYPKKLVERELDKIGIKATDKFYRMIAKPDASAFQFVGIAKPSTRVKPMKIANFSPIDHFEAFYEGTLTNHKLALENRDKEINKLKKELKHSIVYRFKELSKKSARHIKSKLKS